VSARAYRVAPRRRARGRPASRIHWDRLGRVVLVLVLFGVLFSYINPVVNFVDAWRGSHSEQAQFQDLQRERARLAARAASLKEPSTAAEEARKLGMILPGERAYSIKGLPHN
jgi:cell division protein FtsB